MLLKCQCWKAYKNNGYEHFMFFLSFDSSYMRKTGKYEYLYTNAICIESNIRNLILM